MHQSALASSLAPAYSSLDPNFPLGLFRLNLFGDIISQIALDLLIIMTSFGKLLQV